MTTRQSLNITACLLASLLAGCDFAGSGTPINKNAPISTPYDKVCIEGVTYLRAFHSVSVQLGPDSKVIPCR